MTLTLLLIVVLLLACLLGALTLAHSRDERARRLDRALRDQAAQFAHELAAARAEIAHLRRPGDSSEPVGPLVVEFELPVATDDMIDAALDWMQRNPPPPPVNRNPYVPVSPGHADRTEQS